MNQNYKNAWARAKRKRIKRARQAAGIVPIAPRPPHSASWYLDILRKCPPGARKLFARTMPWSRMDALERRLAVALLAGK